MIPPVNKMKRGNRIADKFSQVFRFGIKWLRLMDMEGFRSVFRLVGEVERGHGRRRFGSIARHSFVAQTELIRRYARATIK